MRHRGAGHQTTAARPLAPNPARREGPPARNVPSVRRGTRGRVHINQGPVHMDRSPVQLDRGFGPTGPRSWSNWDPRTGPTGPKVWSNWDRSFGPTGPKPGPTGPKPRSDWTEARSDWTEAPVHMGRKARSIWAESPVQLDRSAGPTGPSGRSQLNPRRGPRLADPSRVDPTPRRRVHPAADVPTPARPATVAGRARDGSGPPMPPMHTDGPSDDQCPFGDLGGSSLFASRPRPAAPP